MTCARTLGRAAFGGLALLLINACADAPEDVIAPPEPAAAVSPACSARPNDNISKLTECVTLDGVLRHLEAFQDIADDNGGTRFAGMPGHDASAAYVAEMLGDAGFEVTMQPLQYEQYVVFTPTILQQLSPGSITYADGTDHRVLFESPSGDVTGAVVGVDLGSADSGCEAADFAGFPAGSIALLSRATCQFSIKALNAESAGAAAVIIYNNVSTGPIPGTLGDDFAGNIPVVGTTQALGIELANTPGLVMRVAVDAERLELATHNVIAETQSGDASNVVIVGAHLGSAPASPGINDNGSGSAALLETAIQMAGVKTRSRIRFAWWAGAVPPVGSAHYVSALSAAERDAITLYLDANQVASPNFVPFIDVDPPGTSAGSDGIAQVLHELYATAGIQPVQTTSVSSDVSSFALAGFPAAGITAGGLGIKSAAEAAMFGGVAGVAFDPCTGLPCDTFANINQAFLDLNSDILAAAALTFGMNTAAVNGKKGKGNFKPAATVSPTLATF